MLNRLFYYCMLLLCGLLIAASFAMTQSAWQHLSVTDGLPQGYVGAILQDSRGFMWFGTGDGLSRYDGYSFKNYRNDPADTTTISTGLIFALHECPSGLLWIGFLSGNIDIFDRKTEQFIHLRNVPWTPTNVPSLASISEDAAGNHWVGRTKEILKIERTGLADTLSGGLYHVTITEDLRQTTESGTVTFTDHTGNVWVFDARTVRPLGRTVPALPKFAPPRYHYTMERSGFAEDSQGILWITLYDSLVFTLYRYDPVAGTTASVLSDSGDAKIIQAYGSGNLWLCSASGLTRISTSNPSDREKITNTGLKIPTSMLVDRSGIVWIGSGGLGLDRYNPAVARFGVLQKAWFIKLVQQTISTVGFPRKSSSSSTAPVYADLYDYVVFRDSRGWEWYPSSPAGCLLYRAPARTLERIPVQNAGEELTPNLFPRSTFVKFLEDRNNTPWFFGWGVTSSYDTARRRFNHYVIKNGNLVPTPRRSFLDDYRITAARKARDGSFWLAVHHDGLYNFDPESKLLRRYSHDMTDTTSLSSNDILSMAEDPSDPRYLWVGTSGGGLNRFDTETGKSTRITIHEGLPNNVIYTIFPDKRGRLWMSTNNGLCALDPKTMAFRYYDVRDGLQGMEFNSEMNFQAADGRIYLEGTDGVNVFYPEKITDNPHISPIVFTDLIIHGTSVSWRDANSPLNQSITESKEISLSFDMNILTFEFAAMDFSNSERNQFSYQLEGFRDEWTKPSKEHTATFTNLSPGTYTLRVRGSNNDGVWNEDGASISLIILPPWYRTWWAYTGYAGLLLTGLYLFRRYDLKRIRLKDQLELAHVKADQLKEVDQLKMQFFQNISHEFRTPLTLILGPIEKLLGGTVPEDTQKRELRMMRRNAQRLLRLINQLLDLSKIEAGGMKLHASKGNMVAFIKGMTMSFHSLAERKEIFLDVHSDLEKLEVYFDREKMEKIVINLLSNAFKFTPDHGEITVKLSSRGDSPAVAGRTTKPVRPAGGQSDSTGLVEIRVLDTGIGIPPEKLPHIFNRFYQVDSSTTRAQEGTGIGLALVKDLVGLHYGTITVMSEPGKGSEFVVSLPLGKSHLKPEEIVNDVGAIHVEDPTVGSIHGSTLHRNDEESDALVHPEQSERSLAGVDQILHSVQNDIEENKPILLIIEDNADVREYIKSYLVPIYTVLEAHDGAEGVERAKESIPDLIISDVMMPKMDGYEVCSRLRLGETTSHIPIILLTAKAAKEDKIGGLETGADDYLIKPFDSAELLVRVKNLIESRRKLREKFGKELVTLKPGEVAVTSVDQAFLRRVMDAIEKKIGNEQFGVEELAGAIGLSSKQLQRKLKGLANTTANDFIRSFRLQRAKELLQKDSTTVAEVAYSVGFSSPAYFTKCFQEQFGTTPSEARKPVS